MIHWQGFSQAFGQKIEDKRGVYAVLVLGVQQESKIANDTVKQGPVLFAKLEEKLL